MVAAIQRQYELGLPGARFDRVAHEALLAEVECADFAAVAHRYGFADDFSGQLLLPFVWAAAAYPGCWPGPAQRRGSCVAHNGKNAVLTVTLAEVARGEIDPVSGKRERAPVISPRGIKNGAFSTEALYWFSGNGNAKRGGQYVEDGWSSAQLARVLRTKAGAVVRGPLGETGVDLTLYDPELEGKYSKQMPAEIADAIDNQLVREVSEVDSWDEWRDACGKGFGLMSDGSEAFVNQRDANGVARRAAGAWQHAMAGEGADDRPSTVRLYGEPLALIANSWGKWNKGPRDVRDSAEYVPAPLRAAWIAAGLVNPQTGNLMIPDGWFWARWSDVRRRRSYAVSGVNGWNVPDLPDLRGGWR